MTHRVTVLTILAALLLCSRAAEAQYRVECRSGKATAYNDQGVVLPGQATDGQCTGSGTIHGVDTSVLDMTQIAVNIPKGMVKGDPGGIHGTPGGFAVTAPSDMPHNPTCDLAGCKGLVADVPVSPGQVKLVEFTASQNSDPAKFCVVAFVRREGDNWALNLVGSDGKPYPANTAVGCAINWSGWEGFRVEARTATSGEVSGRIAAVFKNWSLHEAVRTGQLRVWFER